jgi:hypothetical protein
MRANMLTILTFSTILVILRRVEFSISGLVVIAVALLKATITALAPAVRAIRSTFNVALRALVATVIFLVAPLTHPDIVVRCRGLPAVIVLQSIHFVL